jgi:succinate-semialdehyde dehydrogenase / glutarate-semialdehyde dehydrogenase
MYRSINPYNQSLLAEFPLMNARDIEAKLAKASLAYKHWRKTSFEMRSTLMHKAAGIVRQRKEEFARIIALEMGKVLHEARHEVEKCALGCEYFATHAAEFLKDQFIETEARKSIVVYQPVGAVLGIMPWNFPFWQVFRFAVPALMAGNVCLLKHASNVTQCATAIEKVFQEAGFPDGVFQHLVIENTDVEKVIAADIVQGVALTGSERAGGSVASVAGKHIKKTVLELGGSDPFIVLADADLELTVRIATQSRMQNAGQSCIAAKRFIVLRSIKDEFIHRFKESIEMLKQGDPLKDGVTTGPLARVDLAETLEKQLRASIEQSAKLITGGTRNGANFQPALIDGIQPGMPAFDEETFGPLASVLTVASEDEAIEMANQSRYGLGASVWTKDIERGEHIARHIESGSVFVNALMKSDVRLPFGGVKKSGYGRELSEAGIKEFVNTKTISIATV